MKKNGELSTRCAKAEKRAKEMAYQLEEEMKNVQILQDQVMSLNSKVKKLRENLGDAVSSNSFGVYFIVGNKHNFQTVIGRNMENTLSFLFFRMLKINYLFRK